MIHQNKKTKTLYIILARLFVCLFVMQLIGSSVVWATEADTSVSTEQVVKDPDEMAEEEDAESESEEEESAEEKVTADTDISEILSDVSSAPPKDNADISEEAFEEIEEEIDYSSVDEASMTKEELSHYRKQKPIASNAIEGWPQGPAISAEGAVLIEANTGTILYAKNMHEKLYPASTTKILTTLIAIENAKLDEMVKFSNNAVFSIERTSSNMGMDVGQSITMEQCLYGILVYSANETANAVAEHVGGSIDGFVDMMNEKAKELGCTDSHFVTTNGLHDENHYTSPLDLAKIGRAFFANETLAKISGTKYYVIEPTSFQPDLIELYTHNELTKGTYTYDGYVGGKTGYTTNAHQTLVSCAQRGDMKLICVVMREEAPNQFLDTMTLFDYGFQNFTMENVADNESRYTSQNADFFETGSELFGEGDAIMSISPKDKILLPATVSFADLDSKLSYEDDPENPNIVATIDYSYKGVPLGSAKVELAKETQDYDFTSPVTSSGVNTLKQDQIVFVNVVKIICIILVVFVVILALILGIKTYRDYQFTIRRHPKVKFKPEKRKRVRRPRRVKKMSQGKKIKPEKRRHYRRRRR